MASVASRLPVLPFPGRWSLVSAGSRSRCSRGISRCFKRMQLCVSQSKETPPPASGRDENNTPPALGLVGATMVTYFGVLHFPLSIQGLSVVAHLLQRETLDLRTTAASLLLLQLTELAGAVWLVRDSLKDCRLPRNPFRFSLGAGGGSRNWALAALAGTGVLLLAVGSSATFLQQLPTDEMREEPHGLGELISGDALTAGLTYAVCLGIVPYMEEFVFRGYLLSCLASYMPWSTAVACSSLIFALAHFNLSGLPALFIVGSVLGAAYLWTENLAASFTIHFLYNMLVLVGLLR